MAQRVAKPHAVGDGHEVPLPDHGSCRSRLPRLPDVLPRTARVQGPGVHGDADPVHRAAQLSPRAGRARVHRGHSDLLRGTPRGADRALRDRLRVPLVQRSAARGGDAQGQPRAGRGGGIRTARPAADRAPLAASGRSGDGGAHRGRQEPAQPVPGAPPAAPGRARRRDPPSDALRRSAKAGRAALRFGGGPVPRRLHHRGARGIRTLRGTGPGGVRRRRLRARARRR